MKVVGRADDMLIVKGTNVFPTAIKEVITDFMPSVTGEMRIVLNNPPPRVVPPLILKVEYSKETTKEALPQITEDLKRALHNKLRVTPEIEWVAPGTIERALHKTPVFEKRYEE